MSESPSTTDAQAPAVSPTGDPGDNRKLVRILVALVAVAAVGMVAFGVYYYLTQRIDTGPTQVERAVAISEQKVRDNPNDVTARLALAAVYLKSDRQEEAQSQFQEVLKADATNRSALLGLGGILYDQGDYAAAKERYTTAINAAASGEFAGADVLLQESYYYRGLTELALKDYPTATTDLQKSLVIDKGDADAWNALGTAQLNSGDPKNAAASFQEALLFIPTGWCEPYEGLSQAYQKLNSKDGTTYATAMAAICNGDSSQAQMDALSGLTSGEFKVPALLGLGLAAESSQDLTAAAKWYGQILKDDPKNIAAAAAIARISGNGTSAHETNPTPSASAS